MFILGTRPEAIKLAPLINKFYKHKERFLTKVCVTAQHREMLDIILKFFNIKPDYDLDIMRYNQSLFELTAEIIIRLEKVLYDFSPDIIIVQGDTTSAFVCALAGFYKKIKVAHVEAGLRSFNKYSPFPEEVNRLLISRLADYHFCPTEKAKQNLELENIKENVFVVGNTVIDSLYLTLEIIKNKWEAEYYKYFNFLDFSKKIILVTSHRRENFGKPIQNILYALKEIAENRKDVAIVYPVHLNPNVRTFVNRILRGYENIFLLDPLDYPYFVWLLNKAYLVLTDSGGVQEEATALGKPVLVIRDVTERVEGIEAGTLRLIGTDKNKIITEVFKLLDHEDKYNLMAKATNVYGDGKSSDRIYEILREVLY